MDFFALQDAARKRSFHLTVLYVVGIVLLAFLATLVIDLILYGPSGSEQAALRQGLPFYLEFLLMLGGLAAFLAITGLFRYLSIRSGGHKVAQALQGRQVMPQTTDAAERRLLNIVEEIALASGMPVPGVYLLDHESGINAFAAGYSINDAVIGVTRGALEQLNRDELQAVIGHEFSHVLNGDMRLNMRFAALLFGLLCLTQIARLFMHFSNTGRDNRSRSAILLVALVLYITGLLMSLWGRLIQAAINRQREYLADSSAVQFTRNTALASALKKIGGLTQGSKLESSNAPGFDHLFFGQTYSSLFATHPPLKKRILALEPNWDGQFTAPMDIPAPRPAARPAAQQAAAAAGNGQAGPHDPWAALRSTPRQTAQLAGAALAGAALAGQRPAGDRQASALETLTAASREPFDAAYLFLALLLDNDPQIHEVQAALVGNRELLEKYDQLLQLVDAETGLQLAELCIPALKMLSETQYRNWMRIVRHMIEADGEHSFREWLLWQYVEQNVGVMFRKKAAERQLYDRPEQLAPELGVVLSAFASLGDQAQAMQAFAQAATELGLPDLTYAGQPTILELEAGLGKIRQASNAMRAAFLQTGQRVLEADQRIGQDERLLYRLVALYLDQPFDLAF